MVSLLNPTGEIYKPNWIIKGTIYLNGYWQSEKYFKNIRKTIIKDFQLRKPLIKKNKSWARKINTSNSIGIHVRRGDYITDQKTNKYHGICGINYYKKSINLIKNRIKNPIFFIFSDDYKWVKKKFSFLGNYAFFINNNNNNPPIDIKLMSLCKHNIIANSSFSWWGSWLNTNKDKIVIAPKEWFQDKKVKSQDIIPSNWTKI